MRLLWVCFFTLLMVPAMSFEASAQECPPCYKNTVGPDLIKRARDDNGVIEPVVVVKIDKSWESSPNVTDPKIWNAVRDAVARWNAADPTGPRILVDQGAASDKISVLVKKGIPPEGAPAAMTLNRAGKLWNDYGVLTLTLHEKNASRSQEEVTGRVGHEFGHGIKGLAHPPPELKDMPMAINCPDSIMTESDPTTWNRTSISNVVNSRDVDSAKKWRNDRTNCRYIAGKTEFDGYGGGGTEEPVSDPPNSESREIGFCTEIWDVTNWYVFNDGWKYIGTTYKRLSQSCL